MKYDKKLSFVIPCYYSELSVGHVVEGIFQAFPADDYNYEIILVNDGSKDNTFSVIQELAHKHPQVTAANLSRNFGQDAALMAGYSLCTGDYIISLDDDGQNPPIEAHKLLEKIQEGYDVVFGKYHVKKHSRFKNWGSRLNDRMATCLLNKPKELTLCSYFIMTHFVVDQILKYDSGFPYIWGLILRSTDKIANVYIDHKEREFGTTTFTLGKLVMLWLNGFTSFSIKPLRLASIVGGVFSCLGFLGALYIVISQFFHPEPIVGWASLMCVLLVIGGLLMIMLGLLGEYIGRVFLSINKAPLFIIRDLYSNSKEDKNEN
ncbi:glycosyltransferase family 2 protein [Lactonifactor longoviformis]|uniref:glycosyltransferase family 2 protein n=1 Tax=Lactonifactor longoviformis TaxID=341220 RepID=UPI0036F3C3CE